MNTKTFWNAVIYADNCQLFDAWDFQTDYSNVCYMASYSLSDLQY